jgi:Uma2 family endonuclease
MKKMFFSRILSIFPKAKMDMIKKDGFYGAPDLVIEILSPDTAQYDRGVKRQDYEKEGFL